MYVRRNLSAPFVLRYTWVSLAWTALYACAVLTAFFFLDIKWIDVPFELVSAVGIAVAFFIGFKNNQAYERFWEGRKIWGSIVNLSRTWANQVLALPVLPAEADAGDRAALRDEQRTMVYRHLAWINALRVQLRQPNGYAVRENRAVERLVAAHREDGSVAEAIAPFIDAKEADDLAGRRNVATQLVRNQAQHVQLLRRGARVIDGFEQTQLMRTLESAYDLQGMCERIKNTPFPRQFAYFSHLFTILFCLLLPLGLLDVYEKELVAGVTFARTFGTGFAPTTWTLFAMLPLSVLVSWIFLTWEKIGDSSEDPFEGRPHDVSMSALCRTIEIDLRDMLDEDALPEKLQPRDDILY